MFRSRSRVRRASAAHRRIRLLAPAALAALLAGGDARAVPDETAPDGDRTGGGRRPDGRSDAMSVASRLAERGQGGEGERAHLRRLAEDPDRERRISLAAFLPEILLAMRPVERMEVVAEWATSRSPHLRLAMARALRHMTLHRSTPGAVTALEHLVRDPDPLVRTAVAEAAWLHRREDPHRLIRVLHRLAEDRHLFVREVARLALGDA